MPIEPVSSSLAIMASILSIAASIKSLAQKYKLSNKAALTRYLGMASQKEADLLNEPGIEEAVLDLLVISEKLLEQLAHEAHECEEKHIAARREAKDQTAKEVADTKASGCMCGVLRSISKHNGMKLPDHGPFKNWWDSYHCS